MTYTHLSTNEVVLIEAYVQKEIPVSRMARQFGRARQTIHNVVTYLREGHRALDDVQRYQANKQRCGRRPTVLTPNDQAYVTDLCHRENQRGMGPRCHRRTPGASASLSNPSLLPMARNFPTGGPSAIAMTLPFILRILERLLSEG